MCIATTPQRAAAQFRHPRLPQSGNIINNVRTRFQHSRRYGGMARVHGNHGIRA